MPGLQASIRYQQAPAGSPSRLRLLHHLPFLGRKASPPELHGSEVQGEASAVLSLQAFHQQVRVRQSHADYSPNQGLETARASGRSIGGELSFA